MPSLPALPRPLTFSAVLLPLFAVLAISCTPAGTSGDGDGGSGKKDAGQPGKENVLGTHFEATETDWPLPVGGLKLNSFNALSHQIGFEQTSDEYWVVRDLNGDGLPDLIVTTVIRQVDGTEDVQDIYDEPYGYPASSHWLVYPGTAHGFATTPLSWALPQGGRTARGFNRFRNQEGTDRFLNDHGDPNLDGDEAWGLADLDGDGKMDLVVTGVAQNVTMIGSVFHVLGSSGSAYWKYFKNTGTGFAATAVNWPVPSNPQWDTTSGLAVAGSSAVVPYRTHLWTLTDLNGDSKPDLVAYAEVQKSGATYRSIGPGYPAAPHWIVFENTGSGFSATPTSWNLPLQRGLGPVGLNGLSGSGSATGDNAWVVKDLDGDGKADLVITGAVSASELKAPGYPSDSHWEVYLNTGSGFGGQTLWPLPRGGSGGGGYQSISATANLRTGDQSWTTTDLDGDGKPDLVVTGELTSNQEGLIYQFGRLSNAPQWNVYHNTGTGFAPLETRWLTPAGGLHDTGFVATAGTGKAIGDQSFELVDLDGDKHPELVIVADTIEDPQDVGGGFTINIAPGFGSASVHWKAYRNVP